METLQEKQAPIDKQLVEALIAATPETWNAADMSVERCQDGGTEKIVISITSPEGRKELVGATDEIYEGLYRLSDLFAGTGKNWHRIKYSVGLDAKGEWKYRVDFEY